MLVGFAIHWLPYRISEQVRGWFIETAIPVKLLITVLAVLLILQVNSAELQPFIYFRF